MASSANATPENAAGTNRSRGTSLRAANTSASNTDHVRNCCAIIWWRACSPAMCIVSCMTLFWLADGRASLRILTDGYKLWLAAEGCFGCPAIVPGAYGAVWGPLEHRRGVGISTVFVPESAGRWLLQYGQCTSWLKVPSAMLRFSLRLIRLSREKRFFAARSMR